MKKLRLEFTPYDGMVARAGLTDEYEQSKLDEAYQHAISMMRVTGSRGCSTHIEDLDGRVFTVTVGVEWKEKPKPLDSDCTCYHDCRKDSHSGSWHQHEDEPCPVHPDAQVVG